MFSYLWPILLVVLSNTIYHICSKSTPANINAFAALTITYGVAFLACLILYFVTTKGGNLLQEYQSLNWASFTLGVAIVGLELGFMLAYKAGWDISAASLVGNTLVAVVLIFVGMGLFKETLTWNKIAGIVVCMAGLGLINMK